MLLPNKQKRAFAEFYRSARNNETLDAKNNSLSNTLPTSAPRNKLSSTSHLGGFLVARDGEGRLTGMIGLERHGSVALLRSAAVAPSLQRSGLGSCLTSALLRSAEGNGVEKVVLLTTEARDFFARRFGFVEADRAEFDAQLSGSPEWRLPRCSTAVCMAMDVKHSRLAG